MALELYLSPAGRDTWSGRYADPTPDGLDGPLGSLEGARAALRRTRQHGHWPGLATVWVAGGRYRQQLPVVFRPEDSQPVTFAALPGQQPVFDGGEELTGWQETSINGQPAWVAAVVPGWAFRSLFVYGPGDDPVQGRRAPRARLPKVRPDGPPAFFRMAGLPGYDLAEMETLGLSHGMDSFVAAEGDFADFHNLQDVEVVALHFWVDERMPVASYDPATRTVRSTHRSVFRLSDDYQQQYARYYIENVLEGLSEPGEWYLDRPDGRVYYLPRPGETPENTRLVAPRLSQFLRVEGDAAAGRWVEYLRFENLHFVHADWDRPVGGWAQMGSDQPAGAIPGQPCASAPQAAFTTPGAVALRGARAVTLHACSLRHVGGYGVEIGAGCQDVQLVGCTLSDLGAGGVHVNGASAEELSAGASPALRTARVRVSDCTIEHGGRVFHAGVGVLIRHASRCDVLHNHIYDLFYTGVSCGWVWGYAENAAFDNHIEHNHIHQLGHGWLSDMGGIYLLGVQPGTTVAGNLVYDVHAAHYGGWAIYPDEGSSHLVIENNVGYDVSQQPFHQHYGRENIVRNNVFAFGRVAQVALSRANPQEEAGGWRSFTFSRNVIITEDQPVYIGGYGADLRERPFGSDLNLFYSTRNAPLTVAARQAEETEQASRLRWDAWQALGPDRHSIVDDPGFVDIAGRDFRLKPGARAREVGFVEIDLSAVGPRR